MTRMSMMSMLRRISTASVLMALAVTAAYSADGDAAPAPASSDQAAGWPLVVSKNDWEVHLYHPRAEALTGDQLTARAVFSITHFDQSGQAAAAPAFGVVWLSAHADTDRESRTITLNDQTVTKVLLANANDQDKSQISELVSGALRGLDPVISLDRVLTALQHSQTAHAQAQKLSTAPPEIIIAHKPSVLLFIDGETHATPLEGTHFERIANTPFMLARDTDSKAYWFYYGSRWYTAGSLDGTWRTVDQVPDQITALAPMLQGFQPQGSPEPIGTAVEVVVRQKPAELISFDGAVAYEPVPGGVLQAASTTDRDLFLDTDTKQFFVLLSGRWYSSPDLDHGPWSYVTPSDLPADFAHIPADSKFAGVRAHVPGTTEADEAVLDSEIPQTAAVKRDSTISVTYDGDPHFQPITGTRISYALNSADDVIAVSPTTYYCCFQGAWYIAGSPQGPWAVATTMPPDLDAIPPDCPVYNTRYVYVYESTPDYCYVGYYPGYAGSYTYDGCVVWGTGYHYEGWWGHHYIPRPCTWGFGMAYNPWTCVWGSDIHATHGGPSGFWAFGVHGSDGRWWGPVGYRPAYVHATPPNARVIAFERAHVPESFRGRAVEPGSNVIYHRPENRSRMVPAPQLAHANPGPRPGTQDRQGDRIISGANGEVYRKQGDTWQQWREHGWNTVPAGRETTAPHAALQPAPRTSAGSPADTHHSAPEPIQRADAPPRPLAAEPEHRPAVGPPVEPRILESDPTPHGTVAPHPVAAEPEHRPAVGTPIEPRATDGQPFERPAPSPAARVHGGTSSGPQIEELEREDSAQERGNQRSFQFEQSRSSPMPVRSQMAPRSSPLPTGGSHAPAGRSSAPRDH